MPLMTPVADGPERKSLTRTWTGVLIHSWGCRVTPARMYLASEGDWCLHWHDNVSQWVLERNVDDHAWQVVARFWPTLKAAMLEVDDAISDLETQRG